MRSPANPAPSAQPWPLPSRLRSGLRGAPDGLVDPTLVKELEDAGYATSRADLATESIADALAAAPEREAASPRADSRWREISVDAVAGVVTRPPGVRLDTGGCGKGLAADLAARAPWRLLAPSSSTPAATCASAASGQLERLVRIDHPLDDRPAHEFQLDVGAVATSGIKTRLWRTESGFAHHLLDPSTGRPAWTGLIQTTSLGTTTLEAETLAKMAFLSGPEGAREILSEHGGVIVLDDGTGRALRPTGRAAR